MSHCGGGGSGEIRTQFPSKVPNHDAVPLHTIAYATGGHLGIPKSLKHRQERFARQLTVFKLCCALGREGAVYERVEAASAPSYEAFNAQKGRSSLSSAKQQDFFSSTPSGVDAQLPMHASGEARCALRRSSSHLEPSIRKIRRSRVNFPSYREEIGGAYGFDLGMSVSRRQHALCSFARVKSSPQEILRVFGYALANPKSLSLCSILLSLVNSQGRALSRIKSNQSSAFDDDRNNARTSRRRADCPLALWAPSLRSVPSASVYHRASALLAVVRYTHPLCTGTVSSVDEGNLAGARPSPAYEAGALPRVLNKAGLPPPAYEDEAPFIATTSKRTKTAFRVCIRGDEAPLAALKTAPPVCPVESEAPRRVKEDEDGLLASRTGTKCAPTVHSRVSRGRELLRVLRTKGPHLVSIRTKGSLMRSEDNRRSRA
ncbi:uncharacterized protein SCHCODRAFT_0237969 [Schizophyllum commune H4-8]|uniref:Uncharacterized protein n=1 Tax=Schizophyllum commune (strain H4-8 / FGSC 9210) TaxID=578458 RepID=D8QJ06_SCHCM|nr:uncharacterized protein SCHCODRAFT_0237969 [Schizophyllum commune H4-8]KAI5885761.1 hypothetical protein SCHCODRAFT_0237969 [Schizophyllum commune H4-8]